MDGSQAARATATRISPASARRKRIVFFDTLLSRLHADEVEAVLAHELGHFKLRHVLKRMAWFAAAASRCLRCSGG